MFSKKILAPKALQNFDDKLLKNHPETWSTRAHIVAYYAIIAILLLGSICFLAPFEVRTQSTVYNWLIFTIIISIVALVVWLIYLLRFNVFKRFGTTSALSRLKVFALYFLSVGLIVLFNYIPLIVETAKANMAFTNSELIKDANDFNLKLSQLHYNELDQDWTKIKYAVEKIDEYISGRESDDSTRTIDTAQAKQLLINADSIIKISADTFTIYTCPDRRFIQASEHYYYYGNNYNADRNSATGLLTNKELYFLAKQTHNTINKTGVKNEIERLKDKYYCEENENRYYNSDNGIKTADIYSRYEITNLNESFGNILERKTMVSDNYAWMFRVWLYITVFITLLLFIYRHSTVKAFFLSLLAIILLFLLTGLITVFNHSTSEAGIFMWMILYFAIFCIIAFFVFSATRRSVITGIAINIFTLGVLYMPLIVVGYVTSVNRYNYGYTYYEYIDYQVYFYYAEWAGFIILIALLPTVIHKLYKRWFALPED